MQTSIAQTVALAIHGNAILRGLNPDRFFPENSTCAFCNSIKFAKLKRTIGFLREEMYAKTPSEGYSKLVSDGVSNFIVRHESVSDPRIDERMSVAFVGGGGAWQIWTILPRAAELWEGRWEIGDQNHPERRIWEVTYRRIASAPHAFWSADDLDLVISELRTVLAELASFATKNGLSEFAKCFGDARTVLESSTPAGAGYHQDIAPPGMLSPIAARLLAAAQTGWVFGGMGSWNDVGFDGPIQHDYERLSERLYRLLIRAIVGAANSSARGPEAA